MYFTFNGISSRDVGLHVKDFPYDIMASRRVKELVLDRYDGTIYTDEGTYESYTLDIECYMVDNFNIANIRKIKNMFKGGKGELILSHKPDNIYKVTINNRIDFTEMLNLTGGCILSFKVEPFSILTSGKEEVRVVKNEKICNLGNSLSKPKLRVVGGNGLVNLIVNGVTIEFENVKSTFIIDCELEDIYGEKGENLNNYMKLSSDFFTLIEGDNTISFTGASDVFLTPNWREL